MPARVELCRTDQAVAGAVRLSRLDRRRPRLMARSTQTRRRPSPASIVASPWVDGRRFRHSVVVRSWLLRVLELSREREPTHLLQRPAVLARQVKRHDDQDREGRQADEPADRQHDPLGVDAGSRFLEVGLGSGTREMEHGPTFRPVALWAVTTGQGDGVLSTHSGKSR